MMDRETLFDAHLTGTLTPEQERELAELLQDDAVGRAFVEYVYETGQMLDAAGKLSRRRTPVRPTPDRRRGGNHLWLLGVAAAGILVAIMIGLAYVTNRPAPQVAAAPVAPKPRKIRILVEHCEHAHLADGSMLMKGDKLLTDALSLAKGKAMLKLPNGVRLKLEHRTELTFYGGKDVRLDYGQVAAEVPAGAVGFTVRTAHGNVTDLGTKFELRADAGGSHLAVLEGIVQLGSATNPAARPVARKGDEVEMSRETGLLRVYPEPGRFDPRTGEFGRRGIVELVPWDAVWRYDDGATLPDPAWNQTEYDDNAWASGKAKIGFGEDDIVTRIPSGDRPNNDRLITAWFRHTFTAPTDLDAGSIIVMMRVDDGAVAYLNGKEIGRFNMPSGPITPTTTSIRNVPERPHPVTRFMLPRSALRSGRNVFAVEVHQRGTHSSDLFLELCCFARIEDPK